MLKEGSKRLLTNDKKLKLEPKNPRILKYNGITQIIGSKSFHFNDKETEA